MSRYPSGVRHPSCERCPSAASCARLVASLTKPMTAGRRSSARRAAHRAVTGTPCSVRTRGPGGVTTTPRLVRRSSEVPTVFQLPDLRAEDLLRHVDALGGGGKAPVLSLPFNLPGPFGRGGSFLSGLSL